MTDSKKKSDLAAIARQHHLPAVYISRFSHDTFPKRRTRRVHGLQRGKDRPVYTKAENFGIAKNIYTLSETSHLFKEGSEKDPYLIERLWHGIEGSLTNALDELTDPENDTIPAHTWARTIVPFIASTLIRGPSFDKQYQSRSPILDPNNKEYGGLLSVDNTNTSRLIELQRLLAPVAASRLIVLHSSTEIPIITNDLGFTYFYCPTTHEPGYVIPLDPSTALGVIPGETNVACEGKWPGSWRTPIRHQTLQPNIQGGLNKMLAQTAQSFIFGPTMRSVVKWRKVMSEPSYLPFPTYLARFTPKTLRDNEFLWHRLISTIALAPGDVRVDEFRMNPEEVTRDWTPVLFFPTERRIEKRSLFYRDPKIIVHMPDNVVSQQMFMDRVIAEDTRTQNVWSPLHTVKATEPGTRSNSAVRAAMADGVRRQRSTDRLNDADMRCTAEFSFMGSRHAAAGGARAADSR